MGRYSDAAYMAKQIDEQLVSGVIIGSITDPEGDSFGFKVMQGDTILIVWVDRDAEGNGAGWLDIRKG